MSTRYKSSIRAPACTICRQVAFWQKFHRVSKIWQTGKAEATSTPPPPVALALSSQISVPACGGLFLVDHVGVAHAHEKQSARRRRRTRFFPVFGIEDLSDFGLRPESATDVHQSSGDRPHHVVQKPVRLHVDPDVLASPVHGQMID